MSEMASSEEGKGRGAMGKVDDPYTPLSTW
jgi:hypothetical protein